MAGVGNLGDGVLDPLTPNNPGGEGGGGTGGRVGFSGSPALIPTPGVDGKGGGGGGGGGDNEAGGRGGSGVIAAQVPIPATSFTYAAGAWWRFSQPGTFRGQAVEVGDRLYVKASTESAHLTDFVVLRFADAPIDRPPPPGAGCPFGPDWDGWRVVVEMFYFENTPPAPTAPTSVSASKTNAQGELALVWGPPASGTTVAYEVEALEGVEWVAVPIDPDGFSASFTFSGTSGSRSMRVRGIGLGGTTGQWATASAVPVWDVTAPALPTITGWKPESSYGRLVVRFTTSASDNDQYLVETQTNSGSWVVRRNWTDVGNSQAVAFAAITGTANNTYRVRLRVRDALGNTSAYTGSKWYKLRPAVQDILPVSSGHWRSGTFGANTSNPSRPYQGYFSDPAFDYVGLAYYGTRWRDACNAQGSFGGKVTVTSMSVVLQREGGGVNLAQNVNVSTHVLTTNPGFANGGRPATFNTSAITQLAYGQASEPNLTTAQRNSLRDGLSFGLAVSGQPYMFLFGVGSASVFAWFGKVRSLG